MMKTEMTPTEPFADPVAYLASFGIEAELIDEQQLDLIAPLQAAA